MRGCPFLVVCLAFSALTPALAEDFFLAPHYPLVPRVRGIRSADFNHDGHTDLAVFGEYNLTVLFGNGQGQFTTGNSYQFPSGVYTSDQVAMADFNNDGNPDFIGTNSYSNFAAPLILLRGNRDGTFQNGVTIPGHQGWSSLLAADINGDGFVDIVAGYTDCSPIPPFDCNRGLTVLFGNGDGTFRAPVDTPLLQPGVMAAGDFNRDGKVDLVMILDGAIKIALGNGNGTFQTPTTLIPWSATSYPSFVAASDVNGDGKLDVTVSRSDPLSGRGVMTVLLGNGDGTFGSPQDYDSGTGLGKFTIADFNGDGKLDIIGEGYGNLSILLGRGDGSFQAPTLYSPGGPSALGDFNNDHKLDVAALGSVWASNTYQSVLYLMLNDGAGGLLTARSYDARAGVASIASADFNGDRYPDLALADDQGHVRLLLGGANGIFQGSAIDTGLSNLGVLVTGDFNNDGKPDLAGVIPSAGVTTTYLGNGDGTFQGPIMSPSLPRPLSLAAGDFNRDGALDLAVTGGPGCDCDEKLAVLSGDGMGRFSPTNQLALPTAHPFPVLADVNQDGNLDIIIGAEYEGFDIFFGNGDGTFRPRKHYLSGQYGIFWSLIAVDLNADGKPDIVAGSGGTLTVLINKGNEQFAPPMYYSLPSIGPGGPIPWLAAADFNGDGKMDIAVGGVSILYGNGDGTFQPEVNLIGHSGDESALLVGDFNNDGAPDLAITHARNNSITVLLNVHGVSASISGSPATAAVNQPVTLTATVARSLNVTNVPGGSVIFADGNVNLGFAPVVNGRAQFTARFSTLGTHSISGVYSGDGFFFPRDIPGTNLQILQALPTTTSAQTSGNPSLAGQPVTFTANVVSPYGNQPTGMVLFSDFGSVIGSGAVSGSTAVFTTSALPVGVHLITAAYQGDGIYAPSVSLRVAQVVRNPSQADTTVAVTADVNPVLFRKSTILSCTVSSGSGTPGGNVRFVDGVNVLATVALNNGQASYPTNPLSIGSHLITVVYDGSSNFAAGASPVLLLKRSPKPR